MNRREIIQAAAAALSAVGAGVDLKGQVICDPTPERKPVAVVIKHPGCLKKEARGNLTSAVTDAFRGTPFDGIKVLVMTEGMDIEVLTDPPETKLFVRIETPQ